MPTDDLGAPVTPAPGAVRLVSLVPSLSELLAQWGLGDQVVGVTDWCVAPPDAFTHAVRVRGTKNPDVARIVALAPTLVVANEEENRELDVRRLREAGVAVHVTRVRTVAEAADSIERLARALGVTAAADVTVDRLRAVASSRSAPGDGVLTLCPIWRDPWMVVGHDTFSGDLLRLAGLRLWPHDPQGRYPEVELAAARAAGVELVLLPDEPYPFGEADRAVFADWPATVRLTDGAALTWWGSRSLAAHHDLSAVAAVVREERGRRG